ncbi:hypothetical protein LTR08_000611 [Meristemomyces frigidus]|nr:hypothetical protein LTR08_000611 [Meristemomyces frigidus]
MMIKNRPSPKDEAEAIAAKLVSKFWWLSRVLWFLTIFTTLCLCREIFSQRPSSANPPDLLTLQGELGEAFSGCMQSSTDDALCASALHDLMIDPTPMAAGLQIATGKLEEYRHKIDWDSNGHDTVVECIRESAEIETPGSDNVEAAELVITAEKEKLSNFTQSLDHFLNKMQSNHDDVLSQVQQLSEKLGLESKMDTSTTLLTWRLTTNEEGVLQCNTPIPSHLGNHAHAALQFHATAFCDSMLGLASEQSGEEPITIAQPTATPELIYAASLEVYASDDALEQKETDAGDPTSRDLLEAILKGRRASVAGDPTYQEVAEAFLKDLRAFESVDKAAPTPTSASTSTKTPDVEGLVGIVKELLAAELAEQASLGTASTTTKISPTEARVWRSVPRISDMVCRIEAGERVCWTVGTISG